jgi:hypothetical protein
MEQGDLHTAHVNRPDASIDDEARGLQDDWAQDVLEVKLATFLKDEMRKCEKTLTDELWHTECRWDRTIILLCFYDAYAYHCMVR